MAEGQQGLTPDYCRHQASICRDLAQRVSRPADRAMLEDIAQTWERIGATIQKTP
jgi:hypothetical protein